jgi:hypothetical protein
MANKSEQDKTVIGRVAAEAADGALGMASRLADRLKQPNPKSDQDSKNKSGEDNERHFPGSAALQGMATELNAALDKTTATLARAKSDSSTAISQQDEAATPTAGMANATGVVFHQEFECSVNYWRNGLKLPEGGKIHLDRSHFAFRGITGTKLSFRWEQLKIEKAARMGGLVNNAFRIIVLDAKKATGESLDERDQGEHTETYLFSTILKDRTLAYNKIEQAIAEANKSRTEITPETTNKAPPFQIPPDLTMQKMTVIGKKKLKGVSLQVRHRSFNVLVSSIA